jgi:catechol 2,3-dioxygenase-like lactoylglutathione lyase family enzyme
LAGVRIHHVAVRVADCERSADFYSRCLTPPGLRRLGPRGGRPDSIWLAAGETILMLERSLRGAGPSEGSGHVLAFEVDDLAATERRLNELGIAITDRTEYTLYVQDPDGHRVGLTVYGKGEPKTEPEPRKQP